MDGMKVFTFAIKRAPKAIKEVMELAGWSDDDVDTYMLHQANAYMVKYITKRAKVSIDKCPININKYGNTSGVTIPLLMNDFFSDISIHSKKKIIICAFGVGLSWGAAALEIENIKVSDIQYI